MNKLITLSDLKDSEYIISSPSVGSYLSPPKNGSILNNNGYAGTLRIHNTFYDLYIPEEVCGKIIIDKERDKIIPVGYGQELFRITLKEDLIKSAISQKNNKTESTEDLTKEPEEGFIIKAFTPGIFYQKPSPEAPPYITENQKIEKGKVLGLIEVMKTFNQIVFQGIEAKNNNIGVVKKIYVKDSQEVKMGQPLFLIGKL